MVVFFQAQCIGMHVFIDLFLCDGDFGCELLYFAHCGSAMDASFSIVPFMIVT